MKRVVIIDDETSARIILKSFLEKFFSHYQIVGEADSVQGAISVIQHTKPDLVFLDIQLNLGTGFNVLEAIDKPTFHVIFITAYENYAIEAFRFAAIDYLLKPLKITDLKSAIARFEQRIVPAISSAHSEALRENLKVDDIRKGKIVLPTMDGFEVAGIVDIVRLESDRNYTRIFLKGGSVCVVSKTLKEFEDMLLPYGFFRIHHSHMIHLQYVRKYIRGQGGEVLMTDEAVIPVSRAKKEEFLSLFLK